MIAIVALFCAWAAVRWVWTPHRCNAEITRLTRATDAAEKARDEYDRLLKVRENLADLFRIREQCRDSVHVYVLIGMNQWLIGLEEESLASYQQALTVDHRPEIYLAIGEIQLALDRFDEAVESYTTAVRFRPDAIHGIPSTEVVREVREKLGPKPGAS